MNDILFKKEDDSSTFIPLSGGWHQVKVPLPFSLKWVNSYLASEQDGKYTVIDPGLRTDDAIAVWKTVMDRIGMSWSDIRQIVLTHQHPDHYGLAGYMQERSGAPVYMSRRSHAYANRLWGNDSTFAVELKALYEEHGMPDELTDAIADNLESFPAKVSPQPAVTYLEAGERFEIGGIRWQLIDAPGHAYGALCFYSEDKRWMLCGDQVLPRITPNVSYIPGEEYNPLADFLDSLDSLKQYDVELALPGHRDPFTSFAGRIDELAGHHARRLDRMRQLLKQQPLTAFEMCEQLFGINLRNNPHNLRFAMSETLAHLHYLERQGLILVIESDDKDHNKPVKRWR